MTDCPCRLLDLDPERWTWTAAGSTLERAIHAVGEAENVSGVMHGGRFGADVEYVYALVRDDRITYVGRSIDLANRLAKHRHRGRDFDEVVYVHAAGGTGRRIEEKLIELLSPPENRCKRRERP